MSNASQIHPVTNEQRKQIIEFLTTNPHICISMFEYEYDVGAGTHIDKRLIFYKADEEGNMSRPDANNGCYLLWIDKIEKETK